MLLSYLVVSRARRQLLQLLWVEGAFGSVSDLARRAEVSFAAAHRELETMRASGLATSERAGAALVYRANRGHPESELVLRLLGVGGTKKVLPLTGEADKVRGWLGAAGAPLLASRPVESRPPLEEALADGLALAHRDAAVARVLPVVLWTHRDKLDHGRLVRAATRRNERQALGFFLELTGLLGKDPRWASLAESLRDRRLRRARPFFVGTEGRLAVALARRKTQPLARRWGFLMNMELDRFASVFANHREGLGRRRR